MKSNSKEFKKLQASWYKKLKDSGFEDAEKNEYDLLFSSDHFKSKRDIHEVTVQAKEEYYRLAEHFLNSHKFKDDTERFIWAQHADGVSIRNITKALKLKNIAAYRCSVHYTVQRLAKLMKLGIRDDG